ncbi:MAG: hypothetical protein H6622_13240 [Halobacteriovoraceae bacterium]|nr:hypothetical protein [Halobacteriovoraceae bacterium]
MKLFVLIALVISLASCSKGSVNVSSNGAGEQGDQGTPAPSGVSASSINNSNSTAGLQEDRVITITNNEDAPMSNISSKKETGGLKYKGGSFPGTGGTCSGVTLNKGESCTIVLEDPNTDNSGNKSAFLSYDQSGQTKTVEVTSVGTPVKPDDGTAVVSSDVYTQPTNVFIGENAPQTLSLSNFSNLGTIGSISLNTASGASLVSLGDCSGTTLNANEVCSIQINVAVQSSSYTASISFDYIDNNGSTQTLVVEIPVEPVLRPVANLSVSGAAIGDVEGNSALSEQTLTITNNGDTNSLAESMNIVLPSVSGANLALVNDNCSGQSLASGASCTFGVQSTDVGAVVNHNINIGYSENGAITSGTTQTLAINPVYGVIDLEINGDSTGPVDVGMTFSLTLKNNSAYKAKFVGIYVDTSKLGGTGGGDCQSGINWLLPAGSSCTIELTKNSFTLSKPTYPFTVTYELFNGSTVDVDLDAKDAVKRTVYTGSSDTARFTAMLSFDKEHTYTLYSKADQPTKVISVSSIVKLGDNFYFDGNDNTGAAGKCIVKVNDNLTSENIYCSSTLGSNLLSLQVSGNKIYFADAQNSTNILLYSYDGINLVQETDTPFTSGSAVMPGIMSPIVRVHNNLVFMSGGDDNFFDMGNADSDFGVLDLTDSKFYAADSSTPNTYLNDGSPSLIHTVEDSNFPFGIEKGTHAFHLAFESAGLTGQYFYTTAGANKANLVSTGSYELFQYSTYSIPSGTEGYNVDNGNIFNVTDGGFDMLLQDGTIANMFHFNKNDGTITQKYNLDIDLDTFMYPGLSSNGTQRKYSVILGDELCYIIQGATLNDVEQSLVKCVNVNTNAEKTLTLPLGIRYMYHNGSLLYIFTRSQTCLDGGGTWCYGVYTYDGTDEATIKAADDTFKTEVYGMITLEGEDLFYAKKRDTGLYVFLDSTMSEIPYFGNFISESNATLFFSHIVQN